MLRQLIRILLSSSSKSEYGNPSPLIYSRGALRCIQKNQIKRLQHQRANCGQCVYDLSLALCQPSEVSNCKKKGGKVLEEYSRKLLFELLFVNIRTRIRVKLEKIQESWPFRNERCPPRGPPRSIKMRNYEESLSHTMMMYLSIPAIFQKQNNSSIVLTRSVLTGNLGRGMGNLWMLSMFVGVRTVHQKGASSDPGNGLPDPLVRGLGARAHAKPR